MARPSISGLALLLAVGAGRARAACTLVDVDARISGDGHGGLSIDERYTWEVGPGDPACRRLVLPDVDGAAAGQTEVAARIHFWDDSRRRLGADRLARTWVDTNEGAVGAWVLAAPELLPDDRLVVKRRSTVPAGHAMSWNPLSLGPAAVVSVEVSAAALGVAPGAPASPAPGGRYQYTGAGAPRFERPGAAPAPPRAPLDDRGDTVQVVHFEHELQLQFPADDPLAAFTQPGTGSTGHVLARGELLAQGPFVRVLRVPADATGSWAEARVEAQPLAVRAIAGGYEVAGSIDAGATLELRWGWTSPGVAAAGVEWPVAPQPPQRWTLRVTGADVVVGADAARGEGSVALDPAAPAAYTSPLAWRVHSVNGTPVLPDAAALRAGIARAAAHASMPEPAVPLAAKRFDDGAPLLAGVLGLLQERVRTGATPYLTPLRPRKLLRARRSGFATPWEQALILSRYLQQLRIVVEPMPVRLRGASLSDPASPVEVDHAVVRVGDGAQAVFIDPTCRQCALGELPPAFDRAQVLASSIAELPAAALGRSERVLVVRAAGDSRPHALRVRLDGPAALSLRLALAEVAPAERVPAVLRWVHAEGATLVEIEGAEVPGAPIRIDVVGEVALAMPLPAAVALGDGGRARLPWAGEWRQVTIVEDALVAQRAPEAAAASAGGVQWRRDLRADGDDLRIDETLRAEDLLVDSDALAVLAIVLD